MQEQLVDIEQNDDIALTDPDSKMMPVKNSGREVSHNVQIAVESSNHLIVAVDVTSEALDREQLHNISEPAREELDAPTLTVIADKGYYSAKQFMLCERDNIFAIAPKPTLQSAPNERYAKDKFFYDEVLDAYTCPEGNLLAHVKKTLHIQTRGRKLYQSIDLQAMCCARAVHEKSLPHNSGSQIPTICRSSGYPHSSEQRIVSAAQVFGRASIRHGKKSIRLHIFSD